MITAPIPPPATQTFSHGIVHPDLFLWDSWCCETDSGFDLYCLALAKKDGNGQPILPSERNRYFFHIRHFYSADGGDQWLDQGCVQQPGTASDGHDARNIWSGSVLNLGATEKLHAYTGISQGSEDYPFIQSIAISHCRHGEAHSKGTVVLCPVRDREQILKAGYYLPDPGSIGSKDGEEGGPILAWRDPFLFRDVDGTLMMAWAAKVAPGSGAVGLASLVMDEQYNCKVATLFPPVVLPDNNEFTQLEVPKIHFDPEAKRYILCTSTTDRQSESQPQSEVTMVMRLYYSDDLKSGWTPGGKESSVLAGVDNQFGMSVLHIDDEKNILHCFAPYTEKAGKVQLSFPSKFLIDLAGLGKDGQIKAITKIHQR